MSIQNHLVNIDGSYHSIKTLLVNINGSWHQSTDILSNVNSIWKHLLHIVTLPSVSNTSIAYTGGAVGPTISYDTTYVDVSGTTSATSVGTYNITFTLKNNCIWSDGTTAPKSYTWSIKQVYTYNKTAYVWKKYNTKTSYVITHGETISMNDEPLSNLDWLGNAIVTVYRTAKVSTSGEITLSNSTQLHLDAWRGSYHTDYPYYKYDSSHFYEWKSGSEYDECFFYVLEADTETVQGSTYYGTVSSDSSSTYPKDGQSGSYWYVYQGIQTVSTITSEYQLIEGTSTTLSSIGHITMTGYDSVYINTSGNIIGNMRYSGRWSSNYSTFKSTYPYISYNGAWYRVTAATPTSATVVPLTTSKG